MIISSDDDIRNLSTTKNQIFCKTKDRFLPGVKRALKGLLLEASEHNGVCYLEKNWNNIEKDWNYLYKDWDDPD